MAWISKWLDKAGVLGTGIAAMGCAACFPALGSLGAVLGLGFLAHYEGIFINTLLPLFAALTLGANLLALFNRKNLYRALVGLVGPTMVLLTLYPLWFYNWSTYLLYTGLGLMFVVALWDIFSPSARACAVSNMKSEADHG